MCNTFIRRKLKFPLKIFINKNEPFILVQKLFYLTNKFYYSACKITIVAQSLFMWLSNNKIVIPNFKLFLYKL